MRTEGAAETPRMIPLAHHSLPFHLSCPTTTEMAGACLVCSEGQSLPRSGLSVPRV